MTSPLDAVIDCANIAMNCDHATDLCWTCAMKMVSIAEAAEARAAQAEARIKILEHDIEVDDWRAAFVRAEAERDEARRQLDQAVAAEREACAKVAESGRYIHGMMSGEIAYSRETARDIAAAIRASSHDPH